MRNLDFDWSSSIPRSIYSDGADGEGTASMAMGRRLRTDEPVACGGFHIGWFFGWKNHKKHGLDYMDDLGVSSL